MMWLGERLPLLCRLFGCRSHVEDPCAVCDRCGYSEVYEPALCHVGLMPRVRHWIRETFWKAYRAFPVSRCANCRRLTFGGGWIPLCSKKCSEDWTPF